MGPRSSLLQEKFSVTVVMTSKLMPTLICMCGVMLPRGLIFRELTCGRISRERFFEEDYGHVVSKKWLLY